MEIKVKINDKPVQAMLNRLMARTGDCTPAMREIGAFYERSVRENFQNQSAPDGTPWAMLSLMTMMMGLGKKKGWKQFQSTPPRGGRRGDDPSVSAQV